jgi:UDP-2-acetamido-2-deoxy-ribo-hexuluronate aminotransferase
LEQNLTDNSNKGCLVQFIDLKAQYQKLEHDIRKNIDDVLNHGEFICGPEVSTLERQLAEYTGAKHCVSCSSGTDALLLSMMAYGIGPGDAVLTTPFTFIATAETISLLGATPVFVDIDQKTYTISPEKLEESINRLRNDKYGNRLKAIIPVDLFGLPADYDRINQIAHENNLIVIADAAQSLGGKYKGKMVGNCADCTTTSFFPAKPLGCYGDGGAIFTDNSTINEILLSLRAHGKGSDKYDNVRIGINGRLDTLQAAILLSKLTVFPDEIEQRQIIALRYSEALNDVVTIPTIPDGYQSAWAQYSVTSNNRNELLNSLKTSNIPANIYYPKPLHLQKAFSYLGYKYGDFPISEKLSETIFSVPMHPYLTTEDQDLVINCLNKNFTV